MAHTTQRFSSPGHGLLRIVAGFLFTFHGTQKLLGFPGGSPQGLPSWIQYSAGPIELIGGLLILVGLLTRLAAFIASGEMAVAYWMVHGPQGLFPILNHGELAILYCFIFLFLASSGPGSWSLDGLLRKKGS
jgi:putative oxidoreductase